MESVCNVVIIVSNFADALLVEIFLYAEFVFKVVF